VVIAAAAFNMQAIVIIDVAGLQKERIHFYIILEWSRRSTLISVLFILVADAVGGTLGLYYSQKTSCWSNSKQLLRLHWQ